MAAATPRLRADLSIIPQTFGGKASFVVKDRVSRKYYRFGAIEARVLRCFDGSRTVVEIATALAAEGARISEQTVRAFAERLEAAGLLERSIAERASHRLERLRDDTSPMHRSWLFRGEPLRMRWSFGDPDAFIARTLPYLRWMFTRRFLVASVMTFAAYLLLLGLRWSELTAALIEVYSPRNLTLGTVVTLWATAAIVILVHELGHGYACKHFGGEVRELGFMLLYFQPAFYCDVSDAHAFQERRARLWVTASGPWIQLVVASVAAIVWAATAPGTLVWNVALAAMLMGGLTTLFANANPLLPLDGYFALADWLEIPNLRQRSFAHLAWWLRRRVLRSGDPAPTATSRERRVFVAYGALATGYVAILFTALGVLAVGWVGRALGGAGVVLGMLTLALVLRRSLGTLWRTVASALRVHRTNFERMRRPSLLIAAVIGALLLVVPWTLTSAGSMVAWPIASRTVRASDSGVVAQVFVAEGTRVVAGAPLVRLLDPLLERDRLAAVRALDSLGAAEVVARSMGRTGEASRLAAEGGSARGTLSALERRASDLTLRAVMTGVVVTARPEELLGRRVGAGDSLLAIAATDSVELRFALAGAGATRVTAGQVVHFLSYADVEAPWTSRVGEVGAIGPVRSGGEGAAVEARARRVAGDAWRPGVIGEASVELARSNLLGALWWKARQILRADLLL